MLEHKSRNFTFYALIFIFGLAAINIFNGDGWLIIWPDSIGYMNPAVSYIEKDLFTHVNGRGFVYSAIIAPLISWGGIENLMYFQKSLLVGVLFLMLIITLDVMNSISFEKAAVDVVIKLTVLVAYVLISFNPPAIAMTYAVMPETLFMFLLSLVIFFAYFGFYSNCSMLRIVSFFVVLAASFVLPIVKPHFLIATLALPLIIFFIIRRADRRRYIIVLLGAIFLGAGLHLFEKNLQKKYDNFMSIVFGPMSLFCNNANIIYPYLSEGGGSDFELSIARDLKNIVDTGPVGGWNVNQFNGDACTYGGIVKDVAANFNSDPVLMRDFYIKTYLYAALKSPDGILDRLWAQLGWLIAKPFQGGYSDLKVTCNVIGNHTKEFELFSSIHKLCLPNEGKELSFKSIKPGNFGYLFIAVILLSFLFVAWSVVRVKSLGDMWRKYVFVLMIFSLVNLLISLVHTFDVDRYIIMQLPLMFVIFVIGLGVIDRGFALYFGGVRK